MRKIKVVLIVLVICICGYVIFSSIQNAIKYQNVFDEIFYSYWEDDPKRYTTFSSWREIEGLDYWSAEEKTFMGKGMDYTNRIKIMNRNLIGDDDEVAITFLSNDDDTNGMMHIGYSKKLLGTKIIRLSYTYNVDDNILKRGISMKMDDEYVEDSVIDEYLKENNYDKNKLFEELEDILYKQILKDWFQYSNSKFSIDNLGDVEIVE